MTIKKASIGLGAILLFCLGFWAPWVGVTIWSQKYIDTDLSLSYTYDAALVFGGLVDDSGEMSEINQERLLTAAHLAEQNLVQEIILSNTEFAAEAMQNFLLESYPALQDRVVLDTQAVVTSDTCKNELANHEEIRHVLLVSQSYHLPRVVFQCRRLGIWGQGYSAEQDAVIDREDLGFWTTRKIRYNRHAREAFFIWLNILGIYT